MYPFLIQIQMSHTNKVSLANYFLLGFIVLYYLSGFFWVDPVIERQRWDERDFHLPTIQHFIELPFQEAVKDYEPATFPLYHILYGYLYKNLSPDVRVLRALNLSTIFLTAGLLFIYFFHFKKLDRNTVIVMLVAFLSSPFLRATGFALVTDQLPFFFIALSLLAFEYALAKNALIWHILSAVFAFCAFYTRQFYFWVPFYFFFRSIAHIRYPRGQVAYVLSNVILVIPALYLLYVWKGLVPPYAQSLHQHSDILPALPFGLVMFPLYCYPVMLYLGKRELTRIHFRQAGLLLGIGVLYVLFYTFQGFDLHLVKGGLISKIFLQLPSAVAAPAFLFFSYLGALIVTYYCTRNFRKNYYLLLILFVLSLSLMFFQRYADPVLFMSILMFYDWRANKEFVFSGYLYLFIATELALYLGTIVYY